MHNTVLVFVFLLSVLNCGQTEVASDDVVTAVSNDSGDVQQDEPATATDDTETVQEEVPATATDATELVEEETIEEETIEEKTAETPTDTTDSGVFFGFWGLNGYISSEGFLDVESRFGATVFQVASSAQNYTVNTLLPLVQASGMKVTLRMTGGHADYTTSGGSFDLAAWKAEVALWQDSGVQDYIDNGTLVGHMLLDDIFTFGGTNPTASDLDEMARTSEEILPGLMTFVRNKATTMPVPAVGQYTYLDACVNQYTNYSGYSDGPIATYVTAQAAAATSLGLGIINGLNIADGGDGSSGQVGWSTGKYAMSATEITTYGEALLSVPNVMMFLAWEYDGEEAWSDGSIGSDYFDQSELQEALYNLSQIAAAYSGD